MRASIYILIYATYVPIYARYCQDKSISAEWMNTCLEVTRRHCINLPWHITPGTFPRHSMTSHFRREYQGVLFREETLTTSVLHFFPFFVFLCSSNSYRDCNQLSKSTQYSYIEWSIEIIQEIIMWNTQLGIYMKDLLSSLWWCGACFREYGRTRLVFMIRERYYFT